MMAEKRSHIERTKESRADDSYASLYTLRGALREGCRLARWEAAVVSASGTCDSQPYHWYTCAGEYELPYDRRPISRWSISSRSCPGYGIEAARDYGDSQCAIGCRLSGPRYSVEFVLEVLRVTRHPCGPLSNNRLRLLRPERQAARRHRGITSPYSRRAFRLSTLHCRSQSFSNGGHWLANDARWIRYGRGSGAFSQHSKGGRPRPSRIAASG